MTQTIEQLQARVAELEAENSTLIKTIQRDTLTSLKQLATAEQRVAEACADMCDAMYDESRRTCSDHPTAAEAEEAIRYGEYRKFMKGD